MGCLLKGASGLYSRMTIGGVLLAAGAGRRMGGRPKALLAANCVPQEVSAIVAPAGQPIGAQTPEEIALSVLAAVVAARRAVRATLDAATATPTECCGH